MNINPLDLRGPAFLLFYAVCAALMSLLVWRLRLWLEAGTEFRSSSALEELAQDPYQMALLRGGQNELLLTALVSLLERELLVKAGDCFLVNDPEARAKVRRPLDKALLARLPGKDQTNPDFIPLETLLEDRVIKAEIEAVREQLREKQLLPDATCRTRRHILTWSAVAALWFLAALKIQIALSRGHSNVQFLVVLGIGSVYLLYLPMKALRTAAGDKALRELAAWYSKLHDSRQGFRLRETSSELTYLAAVFGSAALPSEVFKLLPPPPVPVKTSWVGDSSGSSCSAGSSSCGSSCGGGGGCGGCGSS